MLNGLKSPKRDFAVRIRLRRVIISDRRVKITRIGFLDVIDYVIIRIRPASRKRHHGRESLRDSNNEKGLGASLSSLDIELPARGLDFYFKSPRGKATVIARPLESRSFSRWLSVAISIGVCFGVVVACWIFSWISQKTALRRAAVLCILLISLISLASWFLPIYGFIALIGSSILLIHGAINSMLRKALPKAAC